MQNAIELKQTRWQAIPLRSPANASVFVAIVVLCMLVSAFTASLLPLQVSIVTVFLFAGPHNWFEFRYFLMRLPLRFGKSRTFFLTAFAGIGLLTITYIALPFVYRMESWPNEAWSIVLAVWNTMLLCWLGLLVWLRAKQKRGSDWLWVAPVLLSLAALNWWAPEFFSLGVVYLHPLVALWFLDRHLARTRPQWLAAYRRCLLVVPLLLCAMVWRLSQSAPLANVNGLFWRITQHSGAELLPGVSSHVLVSVHLFLEMLHYAVWIIALPLIGPLLLSRNEPVRSSSQQIWNVRTVPLARHPRGFPRMIATALAVGLFFVVLLWLGFSLDYSTTRDIYFTVAIAHVLAEAPFLLKML
jgi:hypothetical protein